MNLVALGNQCVVLSRNGASQLGKPMRAFVNQRVVRVLFEGFPLATIFYAKAPMKLAMRHHRHHPSHLSLRRNDELAKLIGRGLNRVPFARLSLILHGKNTDIAVRNRTASSFELAGYPWGRVDTMRKRHAAS